jgi:hypothetical protein
MARWPTFARVGAGLVLLGFGVAKFVNRRVEVDSFETYDPRSS